MDDKPDAAPSPSAPTGTTTAPPAPPAGGNPPVGTGREGPLRKRLMDSVIAPMKRVFSLPLARKARPKPNRPPVRILFVDVGNACRSQVAQAYGLLEGFHAESAGTFPSLDLDPMAVRVLREQGLDISGFRPKVLDVTRLGAYDRVILLGASLPQAYRGLPQVQAWNVLDPHDLPYEAYIRMRDECEAKVRALAREYHVRPPEALLLEA